MDHVYLMDNYCSEAREKITTVHLNKLKNCFTQSVNDKLTINSNLNVEENQYLQIWKDFCKEKEIIIEPNSIIPGVYDSNNIKYVINLNERYKNMVSVLDTIDIQVNLLSEMCIQYDWQKIF